MLNLFKRLKKFLLSHKKQKSVQITCTHGIIFDLDNVKRLSLSVKDVRSLYPRLDGTCPLGCGYNGIAYASYEHYLYGDY